MRQSNVPTDGFFFFFFEPMSSCQFWRCILLSFGTDGGRLLGEYFGTDARSYLQCNF
uniref:Uncharacterized protein n=1 Tax=Picea glauca TaxID=3330 RepID=A0A117NFN7_PICGL|nr:hypothetical protein ABT39_MTgene2635 [Picea glauca]